MSRTFSRWRVGLRVWAAAAAVAGSAALIGTTGASAAGAQAELVASGFTTPTAIAVDSNSNLYVADSSGPACVDALVSSQAEPCWSDGAESPTLNQIDQITSSGARSVYLNLMTYPGYSDDYPAIGLAVDSNGTIAIGNFGGYIWTYTQGGTLTYVSDNFNDNRGMTFDKSGDLYFADDLFSSKLGLDEIPGPLSGGDGADQLYATPEDGNENSLVYRSVAVDSAGDVFVTDMANGTVQEFTAAAPDGPPTTYASGFDSPQGIAINPAGDLFVADYGSGTIYEVFPGGQVTVFSTALAQPYALAEGPLGLYALDLATNSVYLFPNGGNVSNLELTRTPTTLTATWSGTGAIYTCTLLYGYGNPTSFTQSTTGSQCTFSGLDPSTTFGVSVLASNSSTPSVAFAPPPAPPAPPAKPAPRSIVCENNRTHAVKSVTGSNPHCAPGWHRVA